jgi:alkyl sulfatase BDS1-like metallo-beta-lactamase superfamily hydrolase
LKYTVSAEQVKNIPLGTFFEAMGPRLDPVKARNKFIRVGFNITDSDEKFGVVIRNQVAEISNFYKNDYDVIVSVDSKTWKGIILRTESAAGAIASGKLKIDGESLMFLQFSSLFVND